MEPPPETRSDPALLQRGRPRANRLAYPGMLIAILAVAMAAWAGHSGRPAPDVMLLYVGAEDCAPCRAWQNGDGAIFFRSAEFPRIRYREVKSQHLTDVLNDDNWPEELRAYRSQLKRSDGVPLWLVVSGGEIVERKFGAEAWRDIILPKIRSLLRPSLI
ncbi:hypothetical protein [Bradyrhizobium sp.]|uniref:hypothetical protein n=1 Tax=Bradyrhizobium sp. TaxID=376 RepID=UPI00239D8E49|nr:hypothetical protein [Bradyrhizobium sp.]MDE2376356.1 hypothetical protein [Bradyrhizobium sp.]